MAAGDLVTAAARDYIVEMRALLMGDGTNYPLRRNSLSDWENQEVKSSDLDLLGDGTSAGVDRLASKQMVLELELTSPVVATLETRLAAFKTAWALGSDQQLHWRIGGIHRYVTGRTRRYSVDNSRRGFGIVVVTAEFFASNPTITVV